MSDDQIAKIKEVYNNWQSVDRARYSDVPEFCKSVKIHNSDLTEEELLMVQLQSKNKIMLLCRVNISNL